jgi:hypothetical protein
MRAKVKRQAEFDIVTGALLWNYQGGCDDGFVRPSAVHFEPFSDKTSWSDGNALVAFDGTQIDQLDNLSSKFAYQSSVSGSYPPALHQG